MRILKFRAWNRIVGRMAAPFEMHEAPADTQWQNLDLMQFTGLVDRGGVGIYEGDILSSTEYPFSSDGLLNYRGSVEWWEEEGCWVLELHVVSDRVRGAACGGHLSEYAGHCDVVGNIYQNPEMLKAV